METKRYLRGGIDQRGNVLRFGFGEFFVVDLIGLQSAQQN
jgi:hypothetical protein